MSSSNGLEGQIQRAMLRGMGLSEAEVELGVRRQAARERGEDVGKAPGVKRTIFSGQQEQRIEERIRGDLASRRAPGGRAKVIGSGSTTGTTRRGGGDDDAADGAIEGELV